MGSVQSRYLSHIRLKAKSNGVGYKDIYDATSHATKTVNRLKVSRLSEKIVQLTTNMSDVLDEHGFEDIAHELFENLLKASRHTGQRATGTTYAHVTGLCESLSKLLNKICIEDNGQKKNDIKLLKPLASSIQLAFPESEEAAAFSRQVSATVGARNV